MTVHHYIGSPYELPTGSFGIKEKLITIYEKKKMRTVLVLIV